MDKTAEITINKKEVLNDYKLAVESRENSYIGRKEVFMGKAKFGIFGDGKELPQIAMSKVFKNGDFRSGYYRDQTFMMAIGQLTSQQFFAQLYAHTDEIAEPASAGRMMNGHFATRSLDEKGLWKDLTKIKNSSADISCTAGQMPRLVGLAYASKLYRNNDAIKNSTKFSNNGNEVIFGTIGNASTSEGHFYEAINAIGVLQVPVVMSVWDDEYGISVPKEYHTTKGSISEVLSGFQRSENENGFEIIKVRGWNYNELCAAYIKAEKIARKEHVPVLVHVTELTQPQGHSTSGSHERYKSVTRLDWEKEFDCLKKMREWLLNEGIINVVELDKIEKEAKDVAKDSRTKAWKAFSGDIKNELTTASILLTNAATESRNPALTLKIVTKLNETLNPNKFDISQAIKKSIRLLKKPTNSKAALINWLKNFDTKRNAEFSSHVYSASEYAALNIGEVKPKYNNDSKNVDGRSVLNACFDNALNTNPLVFAIGEDVGKIGDVNQGFAGLQDKYGINRVSDTGIRETTIIGQGIGAAMRGLRPIVEIQYLDYLLYAIQTLSDDLATLLYRTKGGQKAPLIIRTRGHRLEGVWHSGSPMGMIINALRGIYVLVPRNMTQAAGFYNTMLDSDDPAIIIESLNGYRLKEKMPENIGEMKIPLGIPEIIKPGNDLTIVTYGSMCRVVLEAANQLAEYNIDIEVIDVQSLLPFDKNKMIVESLKKTNKIIFADEDVPGGASAYMLQNVIEEQEGYKYLDAKPVTITGKEHRPAYGSDGDYYSKPNVEEIFDKVYEIMNEANPKEYPSLY